MRLCKQCMEVKDNDQFYKGITTYCKPCWGSIVKKRRRDNPAVQEYDRQRYQNSESRRKKTNEGCQRRRAENPEKYKAHTAVSNAVRGGRLQRPDRCSRCNEKGRRIEGHHEDYSKPLEVIWLCTLCHRRYT